VDCGKELIIEQNQSYENYLGIEVASAHAGKGASQITVRDNTVSNNKMSGIAIDGYDSQQEYAENNTITNIIIYKNDTKNQESGQIELNYDKRNNVMLEKEVEEIAVIGNTLHKHSDTENPHITKLGVIF